MTLGETELALIDRWQRDFPLTQRPFAVAGRPLGLDEGETLRAFQHLHETGVLSRIGAVVRPHTMGASTLAALRVPQGDLERVAALVSGEPLVNHNYAREHAFNLWFVVAGPDAAAVGDTLTRIERSTSLSVLRLPLVKAYHVDLGFPLAGARAESRRATQGVEYESHPLDRELLAAIEDGLPIAATPFESVSRALGVTQDDVLARLGHLLAAGVISRFGCVVRHRALGFTANAMAVWDVPDAKVEAVAAAMTRCPRVTLCYRRPRALPHWPYNLFCMIHARSRSDALAVIDDINSDSGSAALPQSVLFSTRCFKQRGATFSGQGVH